MIVFGSIWQVGKIDHYIVVFSFCHLTANRFRLIHNWCGSTLGSMWVIERNPWSLLVQMKLGMANVKLEINYSDLNRY
jgi:hypothetical protein